MSLAVKNRNNSFFEVVRKLPEKRQLVYQLIKESEPCSAFDISEKYGKPINEITGRIKELKDKCLIIEFGSKKNDWTKKQNTVYKVVKSQDERIELINKRFVELREKKDQLINDLNLGVSNYTKNIISKLVVNINKQINQLSN